MPRSKEDQARIALLRSTYGLDLLPGRVTGKEPSGVLAGMVQRVRVRIWRRRLGLPVAPLTPRGVCAWCREALPAKKGQTEFPRWHQEWVETHRECEALMPSSPRILERRGGACFEIV